MICCTTIPLKMFFSWQHPDASEQHWLRLTAASIAKPPYVHLDQHLYAVDQHGGLAVLENPSTSMTFDDPIMVQWVQAPFAAQASACQFGKDWVKTWMFVANLEAILAVAKSCPHSHGAADGTFFSRLTAEYPPALAQALASIIAPFLSTGDIVLPLASWKAILPEKLQWPHVQQRIEDGGGIPSTAFHMSRPLKDPLVGLRSRWFKRLSDSKQCLKIVAALRSGCKEPPLSHEELKPYIDDLCDILGCPPGDHLLLVPLGQPFRLHLWYHLASFLGDPDAHFLLELVKRVSIGRQRNIQSFTSLASPCWHDCLARTLARMQ